MRFNIDHTVKISPLRLILKSAAFLIQFYFLAIWKMFRNALSVTPETPTIPMRCKMLSQRSMIDWRPGGSPKMENKTLVQTMASLGGRPTPGVTILE